MRTGNERTWHKSRCLGAEIGALPRTAVAFMCCACVDEWGKLLRSAFVGLLGAARHKAGALHCCVLTEGRARGSLSVRFESVLYAVRTCERLSLCALARLSRTKVPSPACALRRAMGKPPGHHGPTLGAVSGVRGVLARERTR